MNFFHFSSIEREKDSALLDVKYGKCVHENFGRIVLRTRNIHSFRF